MKIMAHLKRQISKGKNGAITALFFSLLVSSSCLLLLDRPGFARSPMRVAVIDFIGDAGGQISSVLRDQGRNSPLIESTDEEMVRVAARGASYTGSLNFSLGEARSLGQSLCWGFYIICKTQIVRRLEADDLFYFDALAGVFIVESRTGRLLHFAFERTRGQSEKEALDQLENLVKKGSVYYITLMRARYEKHLDESNNIT